MTKTVEYGALAGLPPRQFKVREICAGCPVKSECKPEIYTVAKGANQKGIMVDGQKAGSEVCKLPLVITEES